MFTMEIRGDLTPALTWLERMIELIEKLKSIRANMLLANILTASHIHAFQEGGWGWRGGAQWSPTDGFWVEHLEGKQGNRPMFWTGYAASVVHAKATSSGVSIMMPEYMRKFMPGQQHRFSERFEVDDPHSEDWKKLQNQGDPNYMKRIEVQEREVAAVFEEDGDALLDLLMKESGFGGGF